MRIRSAAQDQLFKALVAIKDKINTQIPLAANRFEGFDCVEIDRELSEAENRKILSAVDERSDQRTIEFYTACSAYRIYTQCNELFADYLKQQAVDRADQLSEAQQQRLAQWLPLQATTISQCIQKKFQYLLGGRQDEESVDLFLRTHKEQLASTLLAGKQLVLEDSDFALRARLTDRLAAIRERAQKQKPASIEALQQIKSAASDEVNKMFFLWTGLFLQREQADVGFCGEHQCLGLIHILQQDLLDHAQAEAVVLESDHDSHAFIAINRDPKSDLKDIASWGQDAILFDAWNRLVCYAEDFHKLPIAYTSFPKEAKWSVIATYTAKDKDLHHSITQLDQCYFITGNSELEKRIPRIIEEHQLLSLENREFSHTKAYLYQLARQMRPADFKIEVELFLTTAGNELIRVIPGFAEPKIAVHTAFRSCTKEELQFAMAQAFLTAQHFWASMERETPVDSQHRIDKLAVDLSGNGWAAINFLRKADDFKRSQDDALAVAVYPPRRSSSTEDVRARTLMTLFAKDDYHHLCSEEKKNQQTPIPDEINKEIASVMPFVYFKAEFDSINENVDKIRYLQSCLAELHIELLPYEKVRAPSIRLRSFCTLLRSIAINFDDQQQLNAINELLLAAHHQSVPGLEELYFAAHGLHKKNFDFDPLEKRKERPLRPLGVFAEVESEITRFMQADTMLQAKTAADKFFELRFRLRDHLEGDDKVGNRIAWKGFEANDDCHLPWEKHIAFARQDESFIIAHTLWHFGVMAYGPLWSVFKTNDLIRLVSAPPPFMPVRGRLSHCYTYPYSHQLMDKIIVCLSRRHQLVTSMFLEQADFAEAVRQFYDINYPMLISPIEYFVVNSNNAATRFLLEQFTKVALTGSSADKQVIKDFFFSLKKQRGLSQLTSWYRQYQLKYHSPYMQFLFEQEYNGSKFNLFTGRELIDYFKDKSINSYLNIYEIPALKYINLYELPYDDLTLDCLEQLLPKMSQDNFGEPSACLFHHLKNYNVKALSTHAVRLVRLKKLLAGEHYFHYRVDPGSLDWVTPLSPEEITELKIDDLVYLYRFYNDYVLFPTIVARKNASTLLLARITLLDQMDEKIHILEDLLLQTTFQFPLSDMPLRGELITQWATAVAEKYGKDDQSEEYNKQLTKVINHVLTHASNRDKEAMLEKLAVAIETQEKLSDYLGKKLNPETVLADKDNSHGDMVFLSSLSRYFNESEKDQHQLLDFLSAPLSNDSANRFASYIENHKGLSLFCGTLNLDLGKIANNFPAFLHTFYHHFWDRRLEERAVLIDHVLIPANKIKTDDDKEQAYSQGLAYIARKLFPDMDDPASDDNFAYAFVKAYLDAAEPFVRSILLAGMLVATNETSQTGKAISVGKKLTMLCEHLGPAYIKLAQAIHSYPGTPEHIRQDLSDVKGRANPPRRWKLWRLMQEVVPQQDRDQIARIGCLLGSASYNLALEAEMVDGKKTVLILLRENAALDAKKGFKHLRKTIQICLHPKIVALREALLSIIDEAEKSSTVEMDKDQCEQQFACAFRLYSGLIKEVSLPDKVYQVHFNPTCLIRNGHGYRFITRVYGKEFNDLAQQPARKAIAAAVVETEWVNLLSGRQFDCDRHGSQLRAVPNELTGIIRLGLYDFGEMSLVEPEEIEITQVVKLIDHLSSCLNKDANVSELIIKHLSEHIEKTHKANEPTSYLKRMRKGLLALQDFQKELSPEDLIDILKKVKDNPFVHPKIRETMQYSAAKLVFYGAVEQVSSMMARISTSIYSLFSAANSEETSVVVNPSAGMTKK